MNRSDLLIRQLRYYASMRSPHPVYIGDSSNLEESERIQREVQRLKSVLEVSYEHFPKERYTEEQCEKKLLHTIKEKYAVFCGDDDYQIPESLTKCAEFLENHPDYATAHGRAFIFRISGNKSVGRIEELGEYLQRDLLKDSGSGRVHEYLDAYFGILFSVHRTENMRRSRDIVENIKDHAFAVEVLPSCLSSIAGKSKTLDCLSFARQVHAARQVLPSVFNWITSLHWQSSYEIFRDRIIDELVITDGVSKTEAQETIKKAFWKYLAKLLDLKYQGFYGFSKITRRALLRQFAVKIPGMLDIWRKAQNLSTNPRRINLQVLLNKRSPYYHDFISLYKSITGSIEK